MWMKSDLTDYIYVALIHMREKLMFTYALFAFGFDADDGLPFGLVHNHSPLIAPCQTNN